MTTTMTITMTMTTTMTIQQTTITITITITIIIIATITMTMTTTLTIRQQGHFAIQPACGGLLICGQVSFGLLVVWLSVVCCLLFVVCWVFSGFNALRCYGCWLFVVGYNNSCNNNGHRCCFVTANNNYDQLFVNKPPTNQQTTTATITTITITTITITTTITTNC